MFLVMYPNNHSERGKIVLTAKTKEELSSILMNLHNVSGVQVFDASEVQWQFNLETAPKKPV